jgi:prepilin-type N-terminal cleavage/methylation domain-containing protein
MLTEWPHNSPKSTHWHHRRTKARTATARPVVSGFSLIELLVVMAIVSVLLAIGLPAISGARARARNVECRNRLRQCGIALQSHDNQFGRLPEDGKRGFGFAAFLLPMLDQAPLYNKLSPLTASPPNPDSARVGTEDIVLELFLCPSHFAEPLVDGSLFGRSDYLATRDLIGVGMKLSDVKDGESMTIAIGETTAIGGWAVPRVGDCGAVPNSGGSFASEHEQGANFVFCDASVRFINDSIDASTFRALGTPRGKEVVGEF